MIFTQRPKLNFARLTFLLIIAVLLMLPCSSAQSSWNDGVIILSHPDYAIVTSANVTISGTVSSSYSSSLTVNAEFTPISQAGTWSKALSLASGENTITVRASGSNGTVSKTLHLICTDGAPYITMTNPTADTYSLSEDHMTVQASVYNGSEFHVYQDGSEIESTPIPDAQKSGYTNLSAVVTNLHSGNNNIIVKAIKGSKSVTKSITLVYDDAPMRPLLSIVAPIMPTDPDDYVRVSQSKTIIIGNATRASSVSIKVTSSASGANNSVGASLDSQGNFTKEITLYSGENIVELTASDGVATTTKTIHYIFEDTPVIIIKKPLPTTTVSENKVTITGRVLNTTAKGLTVDGNQVDFNSNGDFSYEYLITDPNQIVVKVIASNGSRLTTQDVTFIYKGKPEVICTSHSDLETVYSNIVTIKGKIQGVSKPYDEIVVKVNNLETDLDLDDGTFSKDVTLKKGSNNITINVKLKSSSLSKSFKLNYSELAIEGAEMQITPNTNGGTLKVFNDLVTLNVPKNAYDGDDKLDFEIREADDVDKDSDDIIYVSKIVRIEGPDPNQPVTLTLKYIDGLRDSLTQRLGIFRYDGGDWESIGGKVDAKKKTVTVEISETGTYAVMAYVSTFRDISGHWAQDDIEMLMAKGVLEGNGRRMFYPEKPVTRAEFAKMLVKALNIPIYEENEPTFRDVDEDYWAYDYIQTAVRAGIIKGKGGGSFDPEATVSRLEAAVMLARAGNVKIVPSKEIDKLLKVFKDKQQINFGQDVVASAIKAGIIKGTADDVFNPKQGTTRAQSAKLISRLMVLQKKI